MFDSPDELLRKIRLGEDTSLELKAVGWRGDRVAQPKRDELANEIAAMANTADGVLLLGIDDKTRDVLGVPIDRLDATEWLVFEICNDSIKPPVEFRSSRMELPDATGELRAILRVDIPRSLYVHQSPGGYFRRQGSSKREMAPDVLARLFQQRSQARLIRFDEQAVPHSGEGDLDDGLARRFLARRSGEGTDRLHKRGLLTRDDTGAQRCTVAGVLLCTRSPERWLPRAFIQAARYRGVRQDSNYQTDAQEITGPLDEQVHGAMAFVRRNMSVAARKDPARLDIPQFSLRAVFEAVVNAVAHRDYSIYGSKTRLFLFDDRLEIYSPGPLPNALTVESLALRQSTRNELVTTLLAKCPVDDPGGELGRRSLMEKRGDGVPIILEESTLVSGRVPEYRVLDDAEVRLTIWGPAGDARP